MKTREQWLPIDIYCDKWDMKDSDSVYAIKHNHKHLKRIIADKYIDENYFIRLNGLRQRIQMESQDIYYELREFVKSDSELSRLVARVGDVTYTSASSYFRDTLWRSVDYNPTISQIHSLPWRVWRALRWIKAIAIRKGERWQRRRQR